MSGNRIACWGAAAVVTVACSLPLSAAAQARGHMFYGMGWRQSISSDSGGMDFRIGLGAQLGPMGIEYQGEHSTDSTFKAADRTYSRITNWISLSAQIPLTNRFAIAFGAGPGLGWIKPPGKASGPSRSVSSGIHEFVRLDILAVEASDGGLMVSLRVEPQHLWQAAVLPGVDHGISAWFSFAVLIGDD